MSRLSVREIEFHFSDDYTQQDSDYEDELLFIEAEYDERIEPEYDPREDDWLFDDWYDDSPMIDPYPMADDEFF